VWDKDSINELGYASTFANPLTTDLASFTPEEPSWDMSKTSGEMHIRQKNQSLYAATRLHLNDDLKLLLGRSEEHTSELQSRENLVCRLLLEKKNLNGNGDNAFF